MQERGRELYMYKKKKWKKIKKQIIGRKTAKQQESMDERERSVRSEKRGRNRDGVMEEWNMGEKGTTRKRRGSE
jgi:hypothetical protein